MSAHRQYQDPRALGSRRPDRPGLAPPEAAAIERMMWPRPYADAPARGLENASPWFGAPVPWTTPLGSEAGAACDRETRSDPDRRTAAESGRRSACPARVFLPRPKKLDGGQGQPEPRENETLGG